MVSVSCNVTFSVLSLTRRRWVMKRCQDMFFKVELLMLVFLISFSYLPEEKEGTYAVGCSRLTSSLSLLGDFPFLYKT